MIEQGLMASSGWEKVAAAKKDGSWERLDSIEKLEIPRDLHRALDSYDSARENFTSFPRSVRGGILEWNQCDEFAENFVSKGPDSVFAYLMYTKHLLPSFDDLAESAQQQSAQFPLQSLAASAIFDSEGNTIQHFTTEDERHYFQVLISDD